MGARPKVNVPLANGGMFRKVVQKLLNYTDSQWDDKTKQAQKAFDALNSHKRLRQKFLGGNPSRSSDEATRVLERMSREQPPAAKIKPNKDGDLEWHVKHEGDWVPRSQCHMGHHPVDAVTYCNNIGRYFGEKSPEVQKWMEDLDNYRMQPGPYNMAMGADLRNAGVRYQPEMVLEGLNHDTMLKEFDKLMKGNAHG